jgi:hypothetical protein
MPYLFQRSIEGPGGFVLSVVFIGLDSGQPVAAGFGFHVTTTSSEAFSIEPQRFTCPGDCPRGVYTFFLGQRDAIDRYTAEQGKNLALSPEDAAKFLVELEIRAGSPGVGAPVDVLRIDKSGPSWMARKSNCLENIR